MSRFAWITSPDLVELIDVDGHVDENGWTVRVFPDRVRPDRAKIIATHGTRDAKNIRAVHRDNLTADAVRSFDAEYAYRHGFALR